MKNKKLFLILITHLLVSLCEGDGTLTFYEENNLLPYQIIAYSNNTLVFRLVERLNLTCNVPNLTFRILYPNGTNNLITVHDYEHQIPSINFCGQSSSSQVYDNILLDYTITNYILIFYREIADNSLYGMMIDWNGNITR